MHVVGLQQMSKSGRDLRLGSWRQHILICNNESICFCCLEGPLKVKLREIKVKGSKPSITAASKPK